MSMPKEELNPNWTFVQTNATTGTGTCWTSQPMALALPPNPNNQPFCLSIF